jgi:predicted MPP superfamily phosphohydrolase
MDTKKSYWRYFKKASPFILALFGLLLLLTSNFFTYRLGLFILCSLAGLYVHARLKTLMPDSRPGRRIFSFVFLLLALAYPLVELLSHSGLAKFLKYVLLSGYYSLPFLLYLSLLTVLGDLLLWLNRMLKIVRLESIRGRKLAAGALGMLVAGSMGIVILGRIHYANIKVNEYRVEIPGQSAKIDHLTIALAADFHISDVTEPRRIEKIIGKINATHPDIVLLPGDLLEGDREGIDVSQYEAMFRKLRAKYGVYASLGNHEYHRVTDRAGFFARSGIDVLDDRFVVIDRSFCLAGRSDGQDGVKQPLDRVLRGTPQNLPLLLMDHDPSNFAETLRHPVAIQLSGHTHNGQLFPVHWIARLKYDLSWGYVHIEHTHFFVTSGAQTWGYPVRTAGDSEIMLIRVTFTHK